MTTLNFFCRKLWQSSNIDGEVQGEGEEGLKHITNQTHVHDSPSIFRANLQNDVRFFLAPLEATI